MTSTSASPAISLTSPVLDEDTAARIALAAAGVAGDPFVAAGISMLGGAATFVAAVHDQQDGPIPLTAVVRQRIRTLATASRVSSILGETCRLGLSLLTPLNHQWPTQVDSLRGVAPLVLWVRGNIEALGAASVAITGSTAPTPYGIHMTIELATGLASRDWVLVAGTSSGIDQLTVRSADAMKTATITVAPTSLGEQHPVNDLSVQVSEVPPELGVTIRSQRRSKHLVAAIASKTIIVEAELSSGALRTAEAAQAMSRPVGVVVPGGTASAASTGCRELARQHGVQLVRSTRDADWLH